jgi:hypothetical protein
MHRRVVHTAQAALLQCSVAAACRKNDIKVGNGLLRHSPTHASMDALQTPQQQQQHCYPVFFGPSATVMRLCFQPQPPDIFHQFRDSE